MIHLALAGDGGDHVEFGVVVQHDETDRVSNGSNEEAGDLGAKVLTSGGEFVLHFGGAMQRPLVDVDKGRAARASRMVRRLAGLVDENPASDR